MENKLYKKIKFDNIDDKVFFAISDLHGDYLSFITIEDYGFEFDNPDHILIVAGDIIEGDKNQENLILDYLMRLDKQNRLIAVLGNHDYRYIGSKYDTDNGLVVPYADGKEPMVINKEEWEFLKSLPIAIKTPYFNVVHGIWSYKAAQRMNEKDIKLLLNASPATIGTISFYKKFGKELPRVPIFKSKEKYLESLIKPTIIGHFYKYLISYMIDDFTDENGKVKKMNNSHMSILNNGAYKNGNLIAIDNCVQETGNVDAFVFKIKKGKILEISFKR